MTDIKALKMERWVQANPCVKEWLMQYAHKLCMSRIEEEKASLEARIFEAIIAVKEVWNKVYSSGRGYSKIQRRLARKGTSHVNMDGSEDLCIRV